MPLDGNLGSAALPPEDVRGIMIDLGEQPLEARGLALIIWVPLPIPVAPVKRPTPAARVEAELRDWRLEPLGRLVELRAEFEYCDRVAAHRMAEANFMLHVRKHAPRIKVRQQGFDAMLFEFG